MAYFIELKKHENHYHEGKCTDYDYLIILKWIFTDGALKPSYIKADLEDPNFEWAGGNVVTLQKTDNANIRVCPFWAFENDEESSIIEIDKQKLIDIIDRWEELVKQKPDEIIMSRDDQYNVSFEPVFYDKDKQTE